MVTSRRHWASGKHYLEFEPFLVPFLSFTAINKRGRSKGTEF